LCGQDLLGCEKLNNRHDVFSTHAQISKMSSFSEAKQAVLHDLSSRLPDNGMEAMWILYQKKALEELTERNMMSEEDIAKAKPNFDPHHLVSCDVRNYMKNGV
jgi:hypothetical protein